MLSTDADAVVCDFAETYHILNLRALPLRLAATLAFGLREDSRIKMKLAGTKVSTDTMLMAAIADRTGLLVWQNTEDGRKNRKRPKSFAAMLNSAGNDTEQVIGFKTGEDFMEAWNRINGK